MQLMMKPVSRMIIISEILLNPSIHNSERLCMRKTIIITLLTSAGMIRTHDQELPPFVTRTFHKGIFHITIKITVGASEQKLGFLYCEQLPFSIGILHTLFITPEYRNQGYATALLVHACYTLKRRGTRTLFIQPGAFERDNDKHLELSPEEHTRRLPLLAHLYKKVGFRYAPRILCQCAGLLYIALGIDEDSRYLMVR